MGHSIIDEVESKELETTVNSSSQCQLEKVSSAYKVGFPPRKNLGREFIDTVKETFFSDDPLRHYKDQPRSKKLILGLQSVFPIFEWGRKYNLTKFKGDLIAGLTIASLCIPQVYLLQ